jgi:pSer/pThr/pTyr-binding forkhead associated (FHA) protein
MSSVQLSTFIIIREDRAEDAKTIVSQGLRIGRFPDSDILLNHHTVSRLHAGISEIQGTFYIINLSGSSATTLNDRVIPFNEAEALSVGDILQIGPFFLNILQTRGALKIKVAQQVAFNVGEREVEARRRQAAQELHAVSPSEVASSLKVFWGKRTREKAGRPSPLHPRRSGGLGRARFNWTPTRDLVRPWPFGIFFWTLLVVGALSAVGALSYKNAFVPRPVSAPHTRQSLTLIPAIAKMPNGNSCTSCHTIGIGMANRETMNTNCAYCHKTEALLPSISRAHREAGITCISCHAEHQGADFRPMAASVGACANCHNNENRELYNGKSMHTPHGGTYGYPVVNGKWIWTGLEPEELAEKPEIEALLKASRIRPDQEQERRSIEFHGMHVYRVSAVAGINRINDIEGTGKEMSCSSCHKSGFSGSNVDRTFPQTTCKLCHGTQDASGLAGSVAPREKPVCVSCHVQHFRDTNWKASLMGTKVKG